MLTSFMGLKVIVRPYPHVEVPRRTHPRKRINKKWRKQFGTVHLLLPHNSREILTTHDALYCYPHMLSELQRIADQHDIMGAAL